MLFQGKEKLGEGTKQQLASPCGIYCGACAIFHDGQCAGCLKENIEAPNAGIKQCRFYKCTHIKNDFFDCSECELFPCKMLIRFSQLRPGQEVRHYRHVTIDCLHRRKKVGIKAWMEEMDKKYKCGEYHIGPFGKEYWEQKCSCVTKQT